jgi:hypothetical protein
MRYMLFMPAMRGTLAMPKINPIPVSWMKQKTKLPA